MKGKVKWFNNKKGFGFITSEDGKDYFVHYSKIEGEQEYKTLKFGENVEFDPLETLQGPQAANVKKRDNE